MLSKKIKNDNYEMLEQLEAEHRNRKAIHEQRVVTAETMVTTATANLDQAKRDYEEAMETLDPELMSQAKKKLTEAREDLDMYKATADKISKEILYTEEEKKQSIQDLNTCVEGEMRNLEERIRELCAEWEPVLKKIESMTDTGRQLVSEIDPGTKRVGPYALHASAEIRALRQLIASVTSAVDYRNFRTSIETQR